MSAEVIGSISAPEDKKNKLSAKTGENRVHHFNVVNGKGFSIVGANMHRRTIWLADC